VANLAFTKMAVSFVLFRLNVNIISLQ